MTTLLSHKEIYKLLVTADGKGSVAKSEQVTALLAEIDRLTVSDNHGAISRLEKERDALQTVMEAAISDASQWKTIAQEREKEILLLRSVLRRG